MKVIRIGLPLAVIALIGGALWLRFTPATTPAAHPTPIATTTTPARQVPAPTSTPETTRPATPVTSDTHTGSDAGTTPEPRHQEQILAVAQAFLQAWTETDPARRPTQLQTTATPRLADPLLAIPTHRIPTTTPTGISLSHATPFAAVVTTSTPALVITLVAAPDTTHGWLVDDIDEADQ